jgi:serine/threonine protein kinase
VAVYEGVRIDDTWFLASEYVEGISQADVIREAGPCSVPQACRLVRQAATGVRRLHEVGLVHRNIKPRKLLREAGTGVVKLTPSTIACLETGRAADSGLQELEEFSRRSAEHTRFRAPEQWTGGRSIAAPTCTA